MKIKFILTCSVLLVLNCKNGSKDNNELQNSEAVSIPQYAKGFEIHSHANYKVLKIISPWQNSNKEYNYALINQNDDPNLVIDEGDFDGIIPIPVKKIVVTSTTHIPALELLGVENTLIGFPETDYISSEKTRQRIDNGLVRELGKNEGINTEVLLEIKPDVIIGFGVDGVNKALENVQKANIPVIYNGDWVESSPLAKAEWIKFFGILYNKNKASDSIFKSIESDYLSAKSLAAKTSSKPTVLCGAMHKDIWYLPNGESTEAQFLKDANVNYLWKDSSGTGSLALNFEVVFDMAKNADIWISPSYYKSYDALMKANQHYTKLKAYKNKQTYSFNNTVGKKGGVLYYELGFARPDLVLKDIIKICHPELLEDYTTYFFKPLE
jgi:iron complex transport system substrate-binding protein